MPDINPTPHIFISAAEQSADEHASGLIREFRRRHPRAGFAGFAGPAMRAAGCDCLCDLTAGSAMAAAAFRRIPEMLRLLARLKLYLVERRFDAAVVVDSPALQLPVAGICRRHGLPVLYYIAPQTWAWGWRRFRNRRIRRRVDCLACIWPFEEAFFRRDGIAATFVGHPTFDRLLSEPVDAERVRTLRAEGSPVVVLLPGSREHVVREVLPGQLGVVSLLAVRFRRARFLLVAARHELFPLIQSLMTQAGRLPAIELLAGPADRAAALKAADLALVASGTVTLEVAHHGTPMLVMYNTNRLLYNVIGRWMVRTPYFAIPNLLAGRPIVPEFMPYYRSIDPIVATAMEWLATPATLARVRAELQAAVAPLARPGAGERTAELLSRIVYPGGA